MNTKKRKGKRKRKKKTKLNRRVAPFVTFFIEIKEMEGL